VSVATDLAVCLHWRGFPVVAEVRSAAHSSRMAQRAWPRSADPTRRHPAPAPNRRAVHSNGERRRVLRNMQISTCLSAFSSDSARCAIQWWAWAGDRREGRRNAAVRLPMPHERCSCPTRAQGGSNDDARARVDIRRQKRPAALCISTVSIRARPH